MSSGSQPVLPNYFKISSISWCCSSPVPFPIYTLPATLQLTPSLLFLKCRLRISLLCRLAIAERILMSIPPPPPAPPPQFCSAPYLPAPFCRLVWLVARRLHPQLKGSPLGVRVCLSATTSWKWCVCVCVFLICCNCTSITYILHIVSLSPFTCAYLCGCAGHIKVSVMIFEMPSVSILFSGFGSSSCSVICVCQGAEGSRCASLLNNFRRVI